MNTKSTSVAVVILNWNKAELTLSCIKNILRLLYENFTIYLVDNGSTDGSAELFLRNELITKSNKITFIANSQNLGYAEGNNVAIRQILLKNESIDYIWLVNNDAIVESDTLSILVKQANSDQRIGLASPILYRNKDKNVIECAGVKIDIKKARHYSTIDLETSKCWQKENPQQVGVMGTAMLLRRSMIDKIGLLNSDLFAYMEDIEYSIRAIKSGYLCITVHQASVYHLERPVFKPTQETKVPYIEYYNTRNEIVVYFWHSPFLSALKNAYWVTRKRVIKINSLRKSTTNTDVISALLSGLWDGYRFRLGKFKSSDKAPMLFKYLVFGFGRFLTTK